MSFRFTHLHRSFDWTLFLSAFLLTMVGLAAIYSIDLSYAEAGTVWFLFKKQIIATTVGVVLVLVCSRVRPEFFRGTSKVWYLAGLILLIAVLLFGETIRGTRGWFTLGGFSFQPVEFMKVGLVLVMAAFVGKQGRIFYSPWFFAGSGVLFAAVIALVLMQPDLGSAFLVGALWYALMWLIPTRRKILAIVSAALLIIATLAWSFGLQEYQKERLRVFLYPQRDPLGAGYNITQSIIAVGSGQWLGRGLGFGSQSQLKFLPESHTDFIFSVIAEELGFVGVLVVVILYGVLLFRLLRLARHAYDDFSLFTLVGCATLIFIQATTNIGAAVGVMPVTGITLPFVSYGGSSLIFNYLLLGIVESIAVRQGVHQRGGEVGEGTAY